MALGFSIGGIASGLDTATMIRQLMQIERQPIVRFEQRQAELRQVDQAWSEVATKLSGLRTALDGIRRTPSWDGFATASSSQPDAVSATVTGSPAPGSIGFVVEALATRHRVVGTGEFSEPADLVGSGSLTLRTADGVELATVETDETTTLAQLATRINDADVGVRATVLKVSDGVHRLMLDATDTGVSTAFSVDTDLGGLGDLNTVREGADARLSLGDGVTVTRGSNTITDLIDGVTLNLTAVTSSEVTITTERDVTAAADAVEAFVTAANDVLSTVSKHTAYNAESGTSGVLQGDSAARTLALQLRGLLSQRVGDGAISHGSQIGMSLTRDGALTLDRAKLESALADDMDAVAGFLGQSFSGPASASFVSATSATTSGTYQVQIDTAATVAAVTGATFTPPGGEPKTFTVTTASGQTVSVTLDTSVTTASQAKLAIEAALADAGIASITVDDAGDVLSFAETRHGSHYGFTIDGLGDGLDGEHLGTDVAGTIGGEAATGTGQVLRATAGDPDGLALRYTGTTTGVIGDVAYGAGLGGALHDFLRTVEGPGGSIQRARDAITGRIRDVDDRIAAFETRLELREATIRRQFTGLETALAQLQAQGNWLAGQLGAMFAQQQ
jgi:flagellar hook-associated protein 2